MSTHVSYILNPDGSPGESWPASVGCNSWCRGKDGGPESEGCRNCWAKPTVEQRLAGTMKGLDPLHPFRPTTLPHRLADPLRWARPRTAFCSHMGDWLDPAFLSAYAAAILGIGMAAQDHTIVTLTKQADRLEDCIFHHWPGMAFLAGTACRLVGWNNVPKTAAGRRLVQIADDEYHPAYPPKNVWLGISVCDRSELGKIKAAQALAMAGWRAWVSFEPLLEDLGEVDLTGIRWIAVGAEQASVDRRREMPLDGVRHLRDAAARAHCGFYFKQAYYRGRLIHEPELDGVRHNFMPWARAALPAG